MKAVDTYTLPMTVDHKAAYLMKGIKPTMQCHQAHIAPLLTSLVNAILPDNT